MSSAVLLGVAIAAPLAGGYARVPSNYTRSERMLPAGGASGLSYPGSTRARCSRQNPLLEGTPGCSGRWPGTCLPEVDTSWLGKRERALDGASVDLLVRAPLESLWVGQVGHQGGWVRYQQL